MKRIFAALVALCIAGSVASAGPFYPKAVSLRWVRTNTAGDNPIQSGAVTTYDLGVSNGDHNRANLGVAVGVEDTSAAVDVRDHALLGAGAFRQIGAGFTGADSVWSGTLVLQGTSGTIDTVTYFREVSMDGATWTVLDSLQGHIVSDRLALTLGAVSDSARVALATISGPAGAIRTSAGMGFWAIPGMGRAGITAQTTAFNFVRFRIHMTPGDFAAAGKDNGVLGTFIYPADEPNFNR